MTARAGAAVAMALLAGPALAAPVEPLAMRWLLAPDTAAPGGEALAARVALDGPPGARVELRAWLAGPDIAGAQVWAGGAWQRADRYQLAWTLDDAGRAEGWLAVRAGEGAGPTSLHLRARDAAGRVLGEVRQELTPAEGGLRAGTAPGPVVGAWVGERLVALAPTHPFAGHAPPWDVPGRFALAAPAGAVLRSVAADGAVGEVVAAPPSGDLRIAALLVDPAWSEEAEFIRIANRGPEAVPLTGWHLDGPGWRVVLAGGNLGPGEARPLVRNASAYTLLTGRGDALDATRTEGQLQLPNAGGAVRLGHWGAPVDAVAWGEAPAPLGWNGSPLEAPPAGAVLRRSPGWPDTDAGTDWDPRPWDAAWGERAPHASPARLAAFTSAGALAAATAVLAGAQDEVVVATYTFTSGALAGALHAALDRGVPVRVLVEGAPVGGVPGAEGPLLDGLAAAGAEVRRIGGSGRDRYGAMHAKYAVVDGATLLLGSENWGPSGFPDGGQGNLGWGAVVRSEALAAHFRAVWDEDADLRRSDVRAWPAAGPGEPGQGPVPAALPPFADAEVTALLVPDNAGPEVLALLGRARSTLDLQALQLPAAWADGPNPVVEALHDAALRGIRVRALLDAGPDNDAAARAMNAWAAEEGLLVEARLSREARVHNKAVVVDGAEAMVGSINFGQAAMTRNREAALLVRGPAVPTWAGAFEADWQASALPAAGEQADAHLLAAPLAVMVLAGVWRSRRRRN